MLICILCIGIGHHRMCVFKFNLYDAAQHFSKNISNAKNVAELCECRNVLKELDTLFQPDTIHDRHHQQTIALCKVGDGDGARRVKTKEWRNKTLTKMRYIFFRSNADAIGTNCVRIQFLAFLHAAAFRSQVECTQCELRRSQKECLVFTKRRYWCLPSVHYNFSCSYSIELFCDVKIVL